MVDRKAFHTLSYGVYIVAAQTDELRAGCVVNTFQQVTSTPAQVSVAVNKDNRINNEFGKTVGDLFGTEVRNLDFTSPKTVNTINGWCS